jgi:hypothetical protein
MAHIDSRNYQTEPADRAHLCAPARTWHALALAAVALMGVAPALVVGALVLVEAVFLNSMPERAHRSRLEPGPAGLRASMPRQMQLSTACTQLELAPCVTP